MPAFEDFEQMQRRHNREVQTKVDTVIQCWHTALNDARQAGMAESDAGQDLLDEAQTRHDKEIADAKAETLKYWKRYCVLHEDIEKHDGYKRRIAELEHQVAVCGAMVEDLERSNDVYRESADHWYKECVKAVQEAPNWALFALGATIGVIFTTLVFVCRWLF